MHFTLVLSFAVSLLTASAVPLEAEPASTNNTDTVLSVCGGVTTSEGQFPLYDNGGCRQFGSAISRFHLDRSVYCYFYPFPDANTAPCNNAFIWRGRGPVADRDFIWGSARTYKCGANP